jgi:hypothetical protein
MTLNEHCSTSRDLFCQFEIRHNDLEAALSTISQCPGQYRHYILFLQSTGYGKTRLCLNIMKNRKALYLLCDNVRNGFSKSNIIDAFQRKWSDASNPDKMEVVVGFLAKFSAFFESHSPEDLFKLQFDEGNGTYHGIAAADLPESPSNDTKTSTNEQQHLLFFDEAHGLKEGLLMQLKLALDQFNLIGVFLSTSGKLEEFLPSISNRSSGRMLMKPVFSLHTTDIYRHTTEIYHHRKLVLGRPLWFQFLQTRGHNNMMDLVLYVASRLRGDEVSESPLNSLDKLSVFMCRFGGLKPICQVVAAEFVTRHLATYTYIGVNDSNLVSGNLVSVTPKREIVVSVAYPSEPVVAEASAYLTFKGIRCSRLAVLQEVKTAVLRDGIVKLNKGDLGELMACALVGYLLDVLREKDVSRYDAGCMSRDVPAVDFLCALCPPSPDDKGKMELLLEGYCINVTHFVRLSYRTGPSTCDIAIDRGVGIITHENCRALDFYMEFFVPDTHSAQRGPEPSIPTVTPRATRSFSVFEIGKINATPQIKNVPFSHPNIHCRVAVKNYVNRISRHTAEGLLNNIGDKCEPVDAVERGGKEITVVSILINVGSGGMDPFVNIFSGRKTRNSDACTTHVQIAVGLNNDNGVCFEGLEQDVIDMVREIASSQSQRFEDLELVLGSAFNEDLEKLKLDRESKNH